MSDQDSCFPIPLSGEPQARRLAQLFRAEPELIRAYLETHDHESLPELGTILAAAKRAVEDCPDYADLHYFAAGAALAADKLTEARGLLARALELNPHYNDALILTARVCMAQGEHDDAILYLRQALISGADYADVHLMLGDLWRQRDETTLARQEYERALELNAYLVAAGDGLFSLGTTGGRGESNELPA